MGGNVSIQNHSSERATTWHARPTFATRTSSARSAFSLIELIITLAILITLVIVTTSTSSGRLQKSRKRACQQNLHTLHTSLQLFANDHQDHYPSLPQAILPSQPLSLLVPQYLSTIEPFSCPGPGKAALPENTPLSNAPISYAYYQGRTSRQSALPLLTDAQVSSLSKTNREPIFSLDGSGPGNNHHRFGGNILHVDGQVVDSQPHTPEPLPLGDGVTLLNPSP